MAKPPIDSRPTSKMPSKPPVMLRAAVERPKFSRKQDEDHDAEAESAHGQVMAAQAQNRLADDVGKTADEAHAAEHHHPGPPPGAGQCRAAAQASLPVAVKMAEA